MKTINITVRDKLPVVTAMSGTAVTDNKYRLVFDFDDEWQAGLKSVVVVGNRRQYVVYPTETDEVEIEFGDARAVSVGVIQDVIATSRPCQIIVEDSIRRRMGVEIVPPDEDAWTYITEQIRLLNAAKLFPVSKTSAMTQPVGRDEAGRLWTEPTGDGGSLSASGVGNTIVLTLSGGGNGGGGVSFEPGNALEMVDGVLNVKTTDAVEEDNTLPITSSGVHTTVGNIGAILDTI